MQLKIGRNTYNVTNKDWILDNDACYQCMTLKHNVYEPRLYCSKPQVQIMSKRLFKELLKTGNLIEIKNTQLNESYKGCKIWRFNFDEN